MNQQVSKQLRTGAVFADADFPYGTLWGTVSDLEDDLARHLQQQPVGTVFAINSTGWMLAESDDGLTLVGGGLVHGVLKDPRSRFDSGLDWVDVEEADLEQHIETLQQALDSLEAGQSLIVQGATPAKGSLQSLEELRAAVQVNDARASFVSGSDPGRVFVGPIVAKCEGAAPGFVQHIGRGTYALHDVAAPASVEGEIVEVKYLADRSVSVKLMPTHARER